MRCLTGKIKRIPSLDQVTLTSQYQLKAALQNKAYFFPYMLYQAIARFAWRNDVNIGLQQATPLGKRDALEGNSTGLDHGALSIRPDRPFIGRFFRRQRGDVCVQRDRNSMQHGQRRRCLSVFYF